MRLGEQNDKYYQQLKQQFIIWDYIQLHICDQASETAHVGTFKYLRNTNLKYSMPHNPPVPDSTRLRFTWEVQQGNSY